MKEKEKKDSERERERTDLERREHHRSFLLHSDALYE
jgi:hypothetical protein